MLTINQNQAFYSSWDPSNAHLNLMRGGVLEKTVRKILTVMFCIPNKILATCFNPRRATNFFPYPLQPINHGYFSKKIITPDNVPLTCNIRVVKGATSDTHTVILFNPLGGNNSVHDGLVNELSHRNCNIIKFDYRGLGSTGRAKDLVIDGESIYQYVTKELGTNPNKIHFYGFSLGGAIAAQVKALHPESNGKYVGDRPFKSVFSMITENCCIKKLGKIVKKITSLVSAIFLAFPIYLLGWEWNGDMALESMKGDKRVIYHPNDILVPFEASLASLCSNDRVICLDPKSTGASTHFSGLDEQNTADGRAAVSVIVDFLTEENSNL